MELLFAMEELHELLIEPMREVRVELSAMTWKVVLEVEDVNGAWRRAPPGRDELFASPY